MLTPRQPSSISEVSVCSNEYSKQFCGNKPLEMTSIYVINISTSFVITTYVRHGIVKLVSLLKSFIGKPFCSFKRNHYFLQKLLISVTNDFILSSNIHV